MRYRCIKCHHRSVNKVCVPCSDTIDTKQIWDSIIDNLTYPLKEAIITHEFRGEYLTLQFKHKRNVRLYEHDMTLFAGYGYEPEYIAFPNNGNRKTIIFKGHKYR